MLKNLRGDKKIGSFFSASSRIVLQRKENTSLIKIVLAQEQKFYTDKSDGGIFVGFAGGKSNSETASTSVVMLLLTSDSLV